MRDRGIIRWVIEHIRPYVKMRDSRDSNVGRDEGSNVGRDDKISDIEDIKDRAEVGIKIRWRF